MVQWYFYEIFIVKKRKIEIENKTTFIGIIRGNLHEYLVLNEMTTMKRVAFQPFHVHIMLTEQN